MTIADCQDNDMLIVDRIYVVKKLVDARNNNDLRLVSFLEDTLSNMILHSKKDYVLRGPVMYVKDIKTVFPDYDLNPPPCWMV